MYQMDSNTFSDAALGRAPPTHVTQGFLLGDDTRGTYAIGNPFYFGV